MGKLGFKQYSMAIFSITLTLCFFLGDVKTVCAQADEFTLEEVTVTAEKREQDLQKTSMSITSVSGQDIIEKSVVTLHDVLKDVPNVVTSDTGFGPVIAIRGLGQDLAIGVGESSVSTNYDGSYQMRPESGVFGFFDIDRVEVLRGPQGTLYGRNATGGAVNVISAKPKINVVEGYTVLEAGNYALLHGEGAINVPINDDFAARVAFVSSRRDPFVSVGDDVSGTGGRVQISYIPSDDVSVTLLSSYISRIGRPHNGEVSFEDWEAGNWLKSKDESLWAYTPKSKNSSYKFAVTAEFPFGPGMVTFLPAYEHIANRSSRYDTRQGAMTLRGDPWGNETYTGELRYASKSDARVQWVGGLYWTETDEPGMPRAPLPTQLKWYKSWAVFGQMTYPFTDTFRGILGSRVAKDHKGYDHILGLVSYPESNSFDFDYFDWKVGIEKDFTDDVLSYLTLSTSHRPGGFEQNTGEPFDMESVISAEVGLKSRLMDERLQMNGDIFYYDYKDYQVVDVYIPEGELFPQGFPYNVDSVENYGAEIEVSALLGTATTFNGSFAWLHTRYTSDFFPHRTVFDPEPLNQIGQPLPHAPDFSLKGSIAHRFSLSGGAVLTPSISARWSDKQYIGVTTTSHYLHPAYTIVDCSLIYDSTQNWALDFYAKNALNQKYANAIMGGQDYFPGNPRQFGVIFNMRF